MASADLARSSTSRLEEFVAFNDELAALVRAGLPLELGLASGRRRIAGRITDRLRQGQSLEDALKAEGDSVPPVYRAVVEAGLRSGRLAEAIETISRSARALIVLRRRLALAAIYPAIVVALAFGLTVAVLPRLLATIAVISTASGEPPPAAVAAILWVLSENPTGWLFWLPVVLLLVLWGTGSLTAIARHLPGLRGALRSYRIAAFAELAAGLMDHGAPFDEALVLGAQASGDRRLARDAADAADRLRAGKPAAEVLAAFRSLPQFARWMIAAGAAQGTLTATLRQVGDWAARKGAAKTDWFSLIAPAVVTVMVAGLAVGAFAAASFGPVIGLIYRLAAEISL